MWLDGFKGITNTENTSGRPFGKKYFLTFNIASVLMYVLNNFCRERQQSLWPVQNLGERYEGRSSFWLCLILVLWLLLQSTLSEAQIRHWNMLTTWPWHDPGTARVLIMCRDPFCREALKYSNLHCHPLQSEMIQLFCIILNIKRNIIKDNKEIAV